MTIMRDNYYRARYVQGKANAYADWEIVTNDKWKVVRRT